MGFNTSFGLAGSYDLTTPSPVVSNNNYIENMGEIELKIFRQNNSGAGPSRNKAISESNFEIIAFLDSDDEWLPEKIEKSMDYMKSGSHVLVAHNGWIVKNKTEVYLDIASRFKAAKNKKFQGLYKRGFISRRKKTMHN